jgi:hypothetical protein
VLDLQAAAVGTWGFLGFCLDESPENHLFMGCAQTGSHQNSV